MIVAFCTSCMDRRWQLELTLAKNLAVLQGTPHFIALVDFNSSDDVGSLIRAQADHLRAGRLMTFRTEEPRSFHMSIAKNTAHRLALRCRPDILFNLDADNTIRPETLVAIEDLFSRKRTTYLHNWSGTWGDGSFGRVALRAADWVRMGGYDEEFAGMGWQDADLMTRCRAAGLSYVHDSTGSGRPIANTFEQKLARVRLPDEVHDAPANEALGFLGQYNFMRSLARPIVLSVDHQRRFNGRLNLEEDGEV